MGRFFWGFIVGGISGVYIAQNYQVPDVRKVAAEYYDKFIQMEREAREKRESGSKRDD
ncbi:hypothetical protein MIR68_005596 [Amoeboaphelidium protococcarum]|nr:hypothetical protein MIR68_005596 [Amoeboaphelidium protococcarum]